MRVNEIEGVEAAAFSTTVVSTSGVPLVVERTMWWDASGYGASTEKAGTEGSTTWYFADGSQGYFHTYFLLFNPNVTATVARVTYLMEDGPAIEYEYPVPAGMRVTVDAGELPELRDRSFGTRIEFGLPALAERAMYFGDTPLYAGGAAAAGITAPATTLVSGRRRNRKFLRHVRPDRESERRSRRSDASRICATRASRS